jgi:hypothetical protein
MRLKQGIIALLLSAGALTPAAAITGCAGEEMVYDSSGRSRPWSHGEDLAYRQWEYSTQRSHLDFPRRQISEQRAYWGWRQAGSPGRYDGHSRR